MAITDAGHLVSENSKTSESSYQETIETAAAAGEVVIAVFAKDNAATADGNTSEITAVTDSQSNTYTKLREFCNSQGAADAGATVSMWMSKLATALATTDTITATLSDARSAKAVAARRFAVAAGNTLQVDGTPQDRADDAADTGALTISDLDSGVEHLIIRGGAFETANTAYTASTNYTAFDHTGAQTAGGAGPTNMAARGEFRVLASGNTTDTTDPTLIADSASAMIALKEVAEGGGSATATPATVAATAAVPAPTVQAGALSSPSTVIGTAAVPAPNIAASAVTSPGVVATIATVPAPTIITGGDATVAPATVAGVAAVPAPGVQSTAVVSPSVVAAVASVPTPTLAAAALASPATVASVATVPVPSLAATAVVSPSTVAAVASIPAPTVLTGAALGEPVKGPTRANAVPPSPNDAEALAGPSRSVLIGAGRNSVEEV